MHASPNGLNLIKSFEGFSADPYQDSAGVWTIGYGHTSGVNKSAPRITERQAEEFLDIDIKRAEFDIERYISFDLNQNQYDALASLVFNVGAAPLLGTLGRLLNAGDVAGAAEQFGRWIYADHKPLKGLIRRREAEKALFLQPIL